MTKVIELFPSDYYKEKGEEFFARGITALESEDYSTALIEFENASSVSPNVPKYLFFTGLSKFFFEEDATYYFERAVELEDDNIEYLNWYGISLFKNNDYVKALKVFEQSLGLKSKENDKAYIYSARALSKTKNHTALKGFVLRAIRHGQNLPELYYELAQVHILELDLALAEELLVEAIELSNDFSSSFYLLSKLYCKQGEFDKAISILKELAYYNPFETELANAKINAINVLKSF